MAAKKTGAEGPEWRGHRRTNDHTGDGRIRATKAVGDEIPDDQESDQDEQENASSLFHELLPLVWIALLILGWIGWVMLGTVVLPWLQQ